jgi:plastocyanin
MATLATFSTEARRAAWLLSVLAAAPAAAGTLRVEVVDNAGAPVERVAVYAVPGKPAPPPGESAEKAVMDQFHNAFVPHVLIVQTGTSVLFPNNDVVSHHVYSFSKPKTFELPLYKGNAHPPLIFDRPGLVVLGCNIHDSMLGYILVVDTPHFAQSDARGTLALANLSADDYAVHIWTDRLRPGDMPAEKTLSVPATGDVTLRFQLEGKLQPDHDRVLSSLPWQHY